MIAARLSASRNGPSPHGDSLSITEVAKLFNVGRNTLVRANTVLAKGTSALIRAVDVGEIAVRAAEEIVALEERNQIEIATEKDQKKRKRKIKEAKRKAKILRTQERNKTKLVLTRPPLGPSAYYTVENWKKLDKAEMRDLIEQGFTTKTKMNEQVNTAIEWAQFSLNTVTGCLHDCPYCYARDIAVKFPYGFAPVFHPSRLAAPNNTQIPMNSNPAFHNIFANSMSDLFGQWVPTAWIEATIEMAKRNPRWNFLTLTKFPQRAADFDFPRNWWMGTTVDAQSRVANAEKAFAKIKCGTKWLSVEPLLQSLKFKRLDLFQWIVIGGASASTKTPAWFPEFDWISDLHQDARQAGLKIYHKTNLGIEDETRLVEFPWSGSKKKGLPKSLRYLKDM